MGTHIARKYDFMAGTKARSAEVDDELTQLVEAHNTNVDNIDAFKAPGGAAMIGTTDGFLQTLLNGLARYGSTNAKYIRMNSSKAMEVSPDGVTWETSASSAHAVADSSGAIVPQRGILKFFKFNMSDDGAQTIVSPPNLNDIPVTAELDMGANTIGMAEYDNGNSSTAVTIDWKKSNHQKVTMTGSCVFTFLAPTKPCMISLKIVNDATAGRTRTFPNIEWAGGTVPTWTSTANAVDILTLYYDGAAYYGQAGLDFK